MEIQLTKCCRNVAGFEMLIHSNDGECLRCYTETILTKQYFLPVVDS